jgi:hypothetical protein
MSRLIILLTLILGLAACGNRDREVQLRDIRKTGNGPDEFAIIPGKPLQAPEDFAALPAPTPGGSNRTDQNPRGDGIAALGGNPGALVAGAVSSADSALVNHASRYGVAPNIRQTLRVEDNEIRRQHGRVNILRILPADDYALAYRREWLDSQAEFDRLRQRGITVPSAPPAAN